MKEATGELNITVITIIAIVAIGALFALFVWPMIQKQLADNTCKTYGSNMQAVAIRGAEQTQGSNNLVVRRYNCCPNGQEGSDCITLESATGGN